MMLSLILLLYAICLTNASTPTTESHHHSPPFKLSVNILKNNKTIPVPTSYGFSDGEQTTMNCIMKCSGSKCDEGHKYSLQFYIHNNHDINKTGINCTPNLNKLPWPEGFPRPSLSKPQCRIFGTPMCEQPLLGWPNTLAQCVLVAETPGIISRTFTLQRNDTEIVCKARYHPDNGHLATSPIRVRLQYVPRPHLAPGCEPRLLKPSPPKITPGYFIDTGKTFALFKCTAPRQGIALMSWQQMKGTTCFLSERNDTPGDHFTKACNWYYKRSERIILKTVMPPNHTDTEDVMHDSLNKTLTESDRDTKLFCTARYILEGPSLSSRLTSKIIVLTLNRTAYSLPQEIGALSLTEWMAIVIAIIITAVIVVIILLSVIFRYRKKVQGYEREEQTRNRPALVLPPPTENVYDQVYGHGAGLKRPRVRPT